MSNPRQSLVLVLTASLRRSRHHSDAVEYGSIEGAGTAGGHRHSDINVAGYRDAGRIHFRPGRAVGRLVGGKRVSATDQAHPGIRKRAADTGRRAGTVSSRCAALKSEGAIGRKVHHGMSRIVVQALADHHARSRGNAGVLFRKDPRLDFTVGAERLVSEMEIIRRTADVARAAHRIDAA